MKNLMKMDWLNRIVCFLKGHKPVARMVECDASVTAFSCERCGMRFIIPMFHKWIRKFPPKHTSISEYQKYCDGRQSEFMKEHKVRIGVICYNESDFNAFIVKNCSPTFDRKIFVPIHNVSDTIGINLHAYIVLRVNHFKEDPSMQRLINATICCLRG
jgi:hypothetical protein